MSIIKQSNFEFMCSFHMTLSIKCFFVLLTLMFSFTSCVSHLIFVKRIYEPGYYVEYSKKKLPSSIVNEKTKVVNYVAEQNNEEIKNETSKALASNSENISEKEIPRNSPIEINSSKTNLVISNSYFPKISYYKYFPSDTLIVNKTQKNKKYGGCIDFKLKLILYVLLIFVVAYLKATITL